MVVKTQKNELLKGLQLVLGVVGVKNTLPILSNVLIQTKNKELELITTNLDIGIVTTIPSDVVEEGAITVPAKKFTEIIKELPDTIITITTKKNNVMSIECESIFFKISGIPKEEFPKLPKQINKNKIEIPQKTLKEMLVKTIFAVSRDETRHVLNGILFMVGNDKISLVATDGRRLVQTTKTIELLKEINIKAIVPTKAIEELIKTTQDEGVVAVLFEENQAMFILNNTTIITRLVEGEFPNYEQAIPKQNKDKLTIQKNAILDAIRRASLLAAPDSQSVRLDIFKEKLVISKHSPNIGEAKEEIACKYTGEEFFIGFNPSYLLEGLRNITQDQLVLEFSGAEKPALARDGDEYLYVVLPMQIN